MLAQECSSAFDMFIVLLHSNMTGAAVRATMAAMMDEERQSILAAMMDAERKRQQKSISNCRHSCCIVLETLRNGEMMDAKKKQKQPFETLDFFSDDFFSHGRGVCMLQ